MSDVSMQNTIQCATTGTYQHLPMPTYEAFLQIELKEIARQRQEQGEQSVASPAEITLIEMLLPLLEAGEIAEPTTMLEAIGTVWFIGAADAAFAELMAAAFDQWESYYDWKSYRKWPTYREWILEKSLGDTSAPPI